MKDRIKMINEMSRSIQIVSIQIDIEDFEMVIHLFENIKLSFLAIRKEVIHYVRLTDTLG